MTELSVAERMKFELFASGMSLSSRARDRLLAENGGRPATPADYASTSGLILALEHDVWVNAPIVDHNASFVTNPDLTLDWEGETFFVRDAQCCVSAEVWIPPRYHTEVNANGHAFTEYAYTHADRVRISPIEVCSMRCHFCDLPYKYRYRTKEIDALVDAVARAVSDDLQPAGHVLISGGTPAPRDIGYVRTIYEAVLSRYTDLPIDIMMVPMSDLLDPAWLDKNGVNEISVNIELVNSSSARTLMPAKHRFGLDRYLDYLEHASDALGRGRVRSMLIVGLEPMEDTLRGVRMIAERGCIPVLSPFRPDDATPLRAQRPCGAEELATVYKAALEIATEYDVPLGPSCIPCTHNTLTLASSGHRSADQWHARPLMV